MNHCPENPNVQDWLDGELAPAEAARFEAHLATCAQCEAEVASFRVVFSELRAVPLLDPRRAYAPVATRTSRQGDAERPTRPVFAHRRTQP